MRVTEDKTTGAWRSQLLIKRWYRRQVLKLEHDICWGGHLVTEKMQGSMLARFVCLGYIKGLKSTVLPVPSAS